MWNKIEKSGFRKVEKIFKPCDSPQHNAPNMMVVPPGYEYVHICPKCGAKSVISSPDITCQIEEAHHDYVMENAMWASPEARHRYNKSNNNLMRR